MKPENDRDMLPEYDFSDGERGRYAGRFYVDPSAPIGTMVVLRRPFPEKRLEEGDVGRIVGKHDDREFEVEFGPASTPLRLRLAPGELRLLREDEILHAREAGAG